MAGRKMWGAVGLFRHPREALCLLGGGLGGGDLGPAVIDLQLAQGLAFGLMLGPPCLRVLGCWSTQFPNNGDEILQDLGDRLGEVDGCVLESHRFFEVLILKLEADARKNEIALAKAAAKEAEGLPGVPE